MLRGENMPAKERVVFTPRSISVKGTLRMVCSPIIEPTPRRTASPAMALRKHQAKNNGTATIQRERKTSVAEAGRVSDVTQPGELYEQNIIEAAMQAPAAVTSLIQSVASSICSSAISSEA